MLVGYARVSTNNQNLAMQIAALEQAGCKRIFHEKVTGSIKERSEYLKLREFIRSGQDTVVVYKLDRLGRSLRHLIDELQDLERNNIGFKSLQENIDTSTSGGKLFFHVFAALAEFERDIIRERTMCGLAAARTRGRLGGRPKKLDESQMQMLKHLYASKENKISDICKLLDISRATLYRLLSQDR